MRQTLFVLLVIVAIMQIGAQAEGDEAPKIQGQDDPEPDPPVAEADKPKDEAGTAAANTPGQCQPNGSECESHSSCCSKYCSVISKKCVSAIWIRIDKAAQADAADAADAVAKQAQRDVASADDGDAKTGQEAEDDKDKETQSRVRLPIRVHLPMHPVGVKDINHKVITHNNIYHIHNKTGGIRVLNTSETIANHTHIDNSNHKHVH